MLPVLFHVFFKASSPSQPHHVVTCVRLVFSFCCTYPCVNFTDTTPSPESSLYFHYLPYACYVLMIMSW
jgi:hypothetical protein